MKYHSTVGNKTFMKHTGINALSASGDSSETFRDLDEIMASPKAEWKRPWWVRPSIKPTIEVDWEKMERFDATKIQQVAWRKSYVTPEEAAKYDALREKRTKEWMLENKPGYTLRDRALLAGSAQGGSVKVSFQGSWSEYAQPEENKGNIYSTNDVGTKLKDPWAAGPLTPEQMGVPGWEGSPEENARMVRAAARHFGADQVGFVELNEKTKKLIYAKDATDGKSLEFENVEKAYETKTKRVLPEKAKWVIVFTVQMSEDLIKKRSGRAPTALSSASAGMAYAQARNIIDRLQNFLHVLGYQGLMGMWFNGLGIAPAFGVMSGLGELSRLNRLITPENGPMVRVFKIVTDLPLAPTGPINAGIMDFCRTCKVCAEKCPTGTLSMDTEPSWKTLGPWHNPGHKAYFENSTPCRTWWSKSTVGCITCFAVCPFSKKDKSFIHNFVKATISLNPLFRKTVNHLMTKMDGYLGYSKAKDIESWWDLNLPPHGIKRTKGTQLE
jgi:epoxyqueuosine reductase